MYINKETEQVLVEPFIQADVNNKIDSNKENRSFKNEVIAIEENRKEEISFRKDVKEITFLTYLYILQGIPLGLSYAIPFIMSYRKVSFADQGMFSLVLWPFSLKLLWAPLVDALQIKRIGRRKTWFVPVQLLMGLFFIAYASYSQKLLYNFNGKKDIVILTAIFISLIFFVATQDIVVDGWAISMLSKENVAWQSTCNSVGQTCGIFIGNVIFIIFESPSFSNSYIRSLFGIKEKEIGMVSLSEFMYAFGALFILTAILIFIFVKEKDETTQDSKTSIIKSYRTILKVLKIKNMRYVVLLLLTVKISFATEMVNPLKLIEVGVSKEKITLMGAFLIPLNIVWPIIISKYVNSGRPLCLYLKAMPFRIILLILVTVFIYFVPSFKNADNSFSMMSYVAIVTLSALSLISEMTMSIAMMGFFASISDERIGSTYMTLLATLSNLGGTYPTTIAMFLISWLTVKKCELAQIQTSTFATLNSSIIAQIKANTCTNPVETKTCNSFGGNCVMHVDAYFIIVGVTIVFSIVWLILFRKMVLKLDSVPKKDWKLK